MSSYYSMKFSIYEFEKILHLKMGGVDFDCPPSFDWGVLVRVVRVIEYPKELGKGVDSRDGGDGDLVNKNDGISCGSPLDGLS